MKSAVTIISANRLSIAPPIFRTRVHEKFHITPSVLKLSEDIIYPISRRNATVKCSKNGSPDSENKGTLKDLLSDLVDERVELLLNKEENRDLLVGLEQASQRVEKARRELAEIEKQEIEARIMKDYVERLESRASEIADCQKEIFEARLMVEEADRYLKEQGKEDSTKTESEMINKDEERLESVKAASLAAFIGVLAQLPILLTRVGGSSQLILPLGITFISCALFGVTFRYAVRRDLDNFQLKSGTAAAFGLVKSLGALEGGQPLEVDASSILSRAFGCAVYVSESLLIFLFAGIALEYCISLGILSPFPINRSGPRT